MTTRPSIPSGAAGLVAALTAHQNGDPYPLILWHGTPRKLLRKNLEAWCGNPEVADGTTTFIVGAAFRASLAGLSIKNERAWMSGVATTHGQDLARARGRAVALALHLAAGMAKGSSASEADEDSEAAHIRVVAAIALLPSPYAQAMTLRHVDGMTTGSVSDWLMGWNPISHDGARYIQKEDRAMLEFALKGGSPRKRWSRRFPGNPRWSTTPPRPPRRL